jgi:tRNA A58 N-methylase Trm61
MGYFLANPLRRLMLNPESLLAPYIREGMTVLEPGPGMGFFTLPISRMVGPAGKVVAVDIQAKMLQSLRRRAQKAGTSERIETRLVLPDSLGVGDLKGKVDFVLAFAVVHELPSVELFFREAAAALKAGAVLLLAEPEGHIDQIKFQDELKAAQDAGLEIALRPEMSRNLAAVLRKA